MHQINEIIIKKLGELERENAIIKSELRSVKEQLQNQSLKEPVTEIVRVEKTSNKDIIELIKTTVTLQFINKLYGK